MKYHVFENAPLGANALFSIIFENTMENGAFAPFGANALFTIKFSKVFETLLRFFLIFSTLSKNRKRCHDLKIAYGVKFQP